MTPASHEPRPAADPAPAQVKRGALGRHALGGARGLGWLLVWLPGALLALLLAALIVLWVWSGTSGSLAQALAWTQDWMQEQPAEAGRLDTQGVQGTLREGGQIERLRWTQPGLTVEADALRLRWGKGVWLAALRGQGVALQELAIGSLLVRDERTPTPTEPLQSLSLPIDITLPWSVGRFELAGNSTLILSELIGLYHYGLLTPDSPPSQGLMPGVDAAHQLTLDSLQLAQGRYRAQLVLGAAAPMPIKLTAQGEVSATVPGGEALTLSATAEATGILAGASASLDVSAQVRDTRAAQASPTLQATARISPWAAQPVVQVNAVAHQLDLSQLWPQAPVTALSGDVQAAPQDGAWIARAQLSNRASGPWDLKRLPIDRLQVELEQRGSRWLVPRLTARVGGAELVAQGDFDPATTQKPATWNGTLKAAGLNPELLWSTLAPLALDADLSASTTSQTDTIALRARIVPSASQPSRAQAGIRLREVRLEGQWLANTGQAGVFAWQEALLKATDLSLNSQGRLDAASKAFNGAVALQLPGAQGAFKGEVAHAQGSGELSLKVDNAAQVLAWVRSLEALPVAGPALQTWLQAQPALRDLQAQGSAQLSATWQGGLGELGFPAPSSASAPPALGKPLQLQVSLTVARLEGRLPAVSKASTASTPATSVSAAGTSAWSVRDLRLKADGRLADLALNLQGEAALAPWRAQFSTAARLKNALAGMSGQAPSPRGSDSSGIDLTQLELQLQDASQPLRPVDWLLRSEQAVSITWSTAATGPSVLAGPGRLSLLPTFSPAAAPAGRAAGRIAPNPPATSPMTLAWDTLRWQAKALQTRGQLRGLPLSWIDALATAPGASAGPLALAGVRGELVFDGDWDVLLPEPGAADAAPLRLTAQLQRRTGDLSVQTDTGTGAPANGGARESLSAGVKTAQLAIGAQGNQIEASLRWDSERLGQARAEVRTSFNANAQPAPGTSPLDAWWPASTPISGTLQAELPQVGVWSALAPPGWRMRGTLKAEAAISGTRGQPNWRGSLQAEELALRSVVDGFEFSNGRLRATLQEERITIEQLTLDGPGGRESGGRLDAKGQAQWRAPTPGAPREPLIDLEVSAEQLRVSNRPDRRLTLSGTVKAQLAGPRLQLRGQLTTDSALIILPDELAPTLGADVIVRGGRNLPQGTGTVQVQPDIEVVLNLGRQFEVRGRGLKTRLRGEVTVRATPLQPTPRVLGEVRTVSGTYRAYGQNLTIETGVLRFTGPYDDPTLDITAIRPQIDEGQRVGVQITGSAQAPRVRLFSDPELPDSEKLAWLVLGRPATGAGAEAAVLQQAALALLARNGGQLDGGLASALGLDELGFRGEGTNADGSTSAAALTLGKQISNKLYLSYERSVISTLGTVSIFYDVSRRLTLRARAGEENAIDLIFTLRYD